MKFIISIIILLTLGNVALAQQKPTRTLGSPFEEIKIPLLRADSGIILPRDTIKLIPAARALAIKNSYPFLWTGTKWDSLGVILNATVNAIDTAYFSSSQNADTIITSKKGIRSVVGIIDYPKGLISGGLISLVSGRTYSASPAVYRLAGRRFSTTTQQVTLQPFDNTPRIDIIVADTFGIVSVITGIESNNPVAPTFNLLSQVLLGTINLNTGGNVVIAVPQGMTDVYKRSDSAFYHYNGVERFAFLLGRLDTMYVTSDSLYQVFGYVDGHKDSTQYFGNGSGGSGGADSTAYHSLTQGLNSSYVTFNRLDGSKDTLKLINGIPDSLQTYTSGASVTVTNGVNVLLIDPSTLQSTLTVTLPATPSSRNDIEIYFGGTIVSGNNVVTTITILANSGQTLFEALVPSTMASGEWLSYKYIPSLNRWYAKR